MNQNCLSCIPTYIQEYIKIQVGKLLRSTCFSYQDKEDLEQELLLFYLEKLENIPKNDPRFCEGFFYASIRNKALEIIRSKRRFSYYSYQHANEEMFQSEVFDNQKDMDDKECVDKMLNGLNEKEQRILMMIMGGANIRETARELNVSKELIYKILKNLKKNYIF